MSLPDRPPAPTADERYFVLRAAPIDERPDPRYPQIRQGPTGPGPAFSYEDGPPVSLPVTGMGAIDPTLSKSPIMDFDEISGHFHVTRQRLVFFCEDYDKGGPMGCGIGAIGLMIVGIIYLVRKSRAKRRSRGLVLSGHIPLSLVRNVAQDGNNLLISSNRPNSDQPLVTFARFRSVAEAENALDAVREVWPPAEVDQSAAD